MPYPVCYAPGPHSLLSMWIDDLIAEGSWRQVRPLWDVEQFLHGGSTKNSTTNWPQTTQNSEEGAFTATVRSCNDCIHSSFNLKIHILNQNISIGGYDWYMVKLDKIF